MKREDAREHGGTEGHATDFYFGHNSIHLSRYFLLELYEKHPLHCQIRILD